MDEPATFKVEITRVVLTKRVIDPQTQECISEETLVLEDEPESDHGAD